MSEEARLESGSLRPEQALDQPPGTEDEFRPSEWESAFLSIALFGGLILFGVGCVLFGWN